MVVLEGRYWLQEALRFTVDATASRLLGSTTTNFGVGVNLAEVATTPNQVVANPTGVIANPSQTDAILDKVVANVAEVVANYYNYYNCHVVGVAIDYYQYNYGADPVEYLILEPKFFDEKHRGPLYFHQLP